MTQRLPYCHRAIRRRPKTERDRSVLLKIDVMRRMKGELLEQTEPSFLHQTSGGLTTGCPASWNCERDREITNVTAPL